MPTTVIHNDKMPSYFSITEARERIHPYIIETPIREDLFLSDAKKSHVFLKCENIQNTGSFKIRGAANKLLSLSPAEREKGVLAVSSGNHGRAVADMARKLGISATIVVSEGVPQHKREAILALGASLLVCGKDQDEAMLEAAQLCSQKKLIMIHPFDDPLVIAGQGTLGLEICEQIPQIDQVVIPLSGGGLLSGIALAVKHQLPACRIIGAATDHSAAMVESLKAGKVTHVEEFPSLADALIGDLNTPNRYTFPMVQALMDEVVQVSEKEILAGLSYAVMQHHLLLEGGAAVGLAAALFGKLALQEKNTLLVLSGANVSLSVLQQVLNSPGYPSR